MPPIKPFNDLETQIQSRNFTRSQQKQLLATKEGVLVNSFVKDPNVNTQNLFDSFVISKDAQLPEALNEKEQRPNAVRKLLLPFCLTTLGVLGGVSGATWLLKNTAKAKLKLPKWEQLQDIPRIMNLNNEIHFATYMSIRNPNIKTALATLASFTFAASAVVLKNYVDGFKEIWVEKQNANVQKNLQENLIGVETKAFSGKMQIVRNMLKENANEFKTVINNEHPSSNNQAFKASIFKDFINFRGSNKKDSQKSSNNLDYILGGAT